MMSDPGAISVDAVGHRRGGKAEVVLTARIPQGTHIEPHQPSEPFLIPTVVEVEGIEAASVDYPEPVAKDLGIADVVLTVYEGAPRFVVRGDIPPDTERVSGTVRYQPCVNGACLPPRAALWETVLEAGSG
jgi:hypothetical protein